MRFICLLFLAVLPLAGQGPAPIPVDPNPNREPEFDEIVPVEEETEDAPKEIPDSIAPEPQDDGVRVSILGYHEFSKDLPDTAMRIRTEKFRKQMEAIKNLGYPVISMADFIAWKKGDGELPKRCFLITIDDGWRSVYTEAYPILKELEFPFTVFLYKQYVIPGGGRALTVPMIEEMMESGLCTVGCHSFSHPFPSSFKRARRKGEDAYLDFLDQEFGESKSFLEELFDLSIPTYAYPGGYFTEDMFPVAEKFGYEYLFTVNPGMTRLDSDNFTLPRHIILGNHDASFELSTTFRTPAGTAQPGLTVQTTRHPVVPLPGALIADRMPRIAAEFSDEPELDPESLVMRVAGLGKVPAVWDEDEKTYSWTVNRPLRAPSCEVSIQWRLKDNSSYELPMRWSFRLDLEAAYQPR
ncbi:MAG: polysaccharide deacetylase family protein [Verrucomicrobiota bacterium JB023]|nr:polysaccharide deacetylase family protein [Verrucomicrobiota bacterium JB023]